MNSNVNVNVKMNGEQEVKVNELSVDVKLDVILEALTELTEKIEELTERVNNLNVSGDGFSEDDYLDE